jgi:hypothetical protein
MRLLVVLNSVFDGTDGPSNTLYVILIFQICLSVSVV